MIAELSPRKTIQNSGGVGTCFLSNTNNSKQCACKYYDRSTRARECWWLLLHSPTNTYPVTNVSGPLPLLSTHSPCAPLPAAASPSYLLREQPESVRPAASPLAGVRAAARRCACRRSPVYVPPPGPVVLPIAGRVRAVDIPPPGPVVLPIAGRVRAVAVPPPGSSPGVLPIAGRVHVVAVPLVFIAL